MTIVSWYDNLETMYILCIAVTVNKGVLMKTF